jgi:hypothetical protein
MVLKCHSTPQQPPRKSARGPKLVPVVCSDCDEPHGEFEKKNVPRSFVCVKCGLGQATTTAPAHMVGHSHKRNYPEGFFDQN